VSFIGIVFSWILVWLQQVNAMRNGSYANLSVSV